MAKLFEPITIREIMLRNRIVISPMCQYSASDGFPNDWHLVHLGTRAVGGTGLVITEATSVSPEGRITPGDLGIWSDAHTEVFRRIANFVHGQGAVAGIQLAHAGRKASCAVPWEGGRQLNEAQGGWQTVAPSDLPYITGERSPVAFDKEGISKVISDFAAAAGRARSAGFMVVEIHSAHGYLLHEFLSPLSNRRTDEYGGPFENRIRLLLEVVKAVRKNWPEGYPLFVRISSTDWAEGGWTIEDSVRLASILKESDVDLIDCSSGGNVYNAIVPAAPMYQVPFSEAIRKTGILTGAVGFITTALQAESILREGKADLVIIAREMLRNPYFTLNAARELGVDIPWPVQYLRAKKV
ncbi:MAG: NADH:flavin oxidoreductase/NADH oxidase [Bacteroidota bacterium]|nr:NADH:flavin oxidoreductase/NADH oxidase [Bacteroidota bacterium]